MSLADAPQGGQKAPDGRAGRNIRVKPSKRPTTNTRKSSNRRSPGRNAHLPSGPAELGERRILGPLEHHRLDHGHYYGSLREHRTDCSAVITPSI
jgi:hypothetical protein